MDISIETELLASRVNEIKQIQNELFLIMEDIEQLVLSVNGSWQGNAEKAYAGRIVYVKKEYGNILSFFEEYAKVLGTFVDEYIIQDTDFYNKINSV